MLIIAWIIYSIIDGFIQGCYYHAKMTSASADTWNLHSYYATQRLAVLSLIIIQDPSVYSIVLAMALLTIYPFFHDGQYYKTRNDLRPGLYSLRWKDKKEVDQRDPRPAYIELDFSERVALLITGVVMMIVNYGLFR